MENEAYHLRRKIKTAIIITIIGLLLNDISAIFLKRRNVFYAILFECVSTVSSGLVFICKQRRKRNKQQVSFYAIWFRLARFCAFVYRHRLFWSAAKPVKNEWIVRWGMIVSAISVVMAFGWERVCAIPLWWSCIDAAIAIAAFIILWLCNGWIQKLKRMRASGI